MGLKVIRSNTLKEDNGLMLTSGYSINKLSKKERTNVLQLPTNVVEQA